LRVVNPDDGLVKERTLAVLRPTGSFPNNHLVAGVVGDEARLSVSAGDFIDQAAAAGSRIVISAIGLAEIVYLIEKNRLRAASAYTGLGPSLTSRTTCTMKPISQLRSLDAMGQVRRADLPNRSDLVAATAVYFEIPVSSRDGKIRDSNVKTIR
jgi:PIN domain nuclease of toxin-antitoxin system